MQVKRILTILIVIFQAAVYTPAFGGQSDPQKAACSDPPPAELLEFIGEWETGEGKWLDPTLLEDWAPDEETRKEDDDETH